jgi:hypothetical protein
MKRLAMIAVVVALTLMTAAPAFAADSVSDTYGGKGGGIVGTVDSGNQGSPPPAPAPQQVSESSAGSLPFTGFDVGLLALGGAALVGIGVGLRRVYRPMN